MNIKYVFIGNSESLKEIGQYPNDPKELWMKNSKTIFEKYSTSQLSRVDQRNKVIGEDGNFYFILMPNKLFILVLADSEFPERLIFSMVDDIIKDNIHLLTDDKGKLNKEGKKELIKLVDSYKKKSNNIISDLNEEVNGIKIEMQNNINKQISNLEDVNAMENRAVKIKESSETFKKQATNLKRITCWQNFKWTIILTLLIIGVLAIIIIPIAISSGNSKENDNNKNNSTLL